MTVPSFIHGGHDNAMTEIALALAMGFFSLMVLTLVSMGSGTTESSKATDFSSIVLAEQTMSPSGGSEPAEDDVFVISWNGGFYNRDGDMVDPATIDVPPGARVVLVVDPKSSLTAVMRARALIAESNVIVAEMNEVWVAAMRALGESS